MPSPWESMRSGCGVEIVKMSILRFLKAGSMVPPPPTARMRTSAGTFIPARPSRLRASTSVRAPGRVTPTLRPFARLTLSMSGMPSLMPAFLAASLWMTIPMMLRRKRSTKPMARLPELSAFSW